MTAAVLVAGWFVCGIAGVSLWNAVGRAHLIDDSCQLPISMTLLGALILLLAIWVAIEIAVTRMDGEQ